MMSHDAGMIRLKVYEHDFSPSRPPPKTGGLGGWEHWWRRRGDRKTGETGKRGEEERMGREEGEMKKRERKEEKRVKWGVVNNCWDFP